MLSCTRQSVPMSHFAVEYLDQIWDTVEGPDIHQSLWHLYYAMTQADPRTCPPARSAFKLSAMRKAPGLISRTARTEGLNSLMRWI